MQHDDLTMPTENYNPPFVESWIIEFWKEMFRALKNIHFCIKLNPMGWWRWLWLHKRLCYDFVTFHPNPWKCFYLAPHIKVCELNLSSFSLLYFWTLQIQCTFTMATHIGTVLNRINPLHSLLSQPQGWLMFILTNKKVLIQMFTF